MSEQKWKILRLRCADKAKGEIIATGLSLPEAESLAKATACKCINDIGRWEMQYNKKMKSYNLFQLKDDGSDFMSIVIVCIQKDVA